MEREMPVTVEENDTLSRIRLEGTIDIGCAAELKTLLERALNSGKGVRLSMADATCLDVTAMQLLWAAGREAARSGVGFALSSPAPEPVSAALLDAGFEKSPIPDCAT
jgi:anti-anti-sigma regulatory factor